MTYAEELVLVDAAIAKALRSQSYTDGQQSVKRADLQVLYARKRELKSLIAGEAAGSGGLAHNYVQLNRAR
jgi:hypothetical protein